MKQIVKFFAGLARENSRRYMLGFQTTAWVFLCSSIFTTFTGSFLFSGAALLGVLCWKIFRSNVVGVRFDLQDVLVVLSGAVNFWLWVVLFVLLG